MSTDAPAATVVGRLWRRRRHLVLLLLLFAVIGSASALFAFLLPAWLAIVDPFGGPTSLAAQLPRLDVVLLALVFCFSWVRLCLRGRPEMSGLLARSASLFGPARVLVRFLAFAGALTILAGLVYLAGTITIRLTIGATLEAALAARPELALVILELVGSAASLLVPFLLALVPLLPVVAVAPLLFRGAMILPAVVAGKVPRPSQSWAESRGAWSLGTAWLVGLVLVCVLAVPSGRLTYLVISGLGGPVWTLLLLLWIPVVLDLIKAAIVGAVLAELLSDRYLASETARDASGSEPGAGPPLPGPA